MKKSLVLTLALVFVLGIAGTAFAANPFVDVPANHWAYASVSKLAAAGIIDGYGDGTFVGSNTMTRYEMAQIVAKAMARSDKADSAMKAQIEKLAAEFSNELDSLGVRVAKLEKNADNVKITGEIRYSDYAFDRNTRADNDTIRTRLWLRGQVNENWAYTGMIEQNGQNFKTNVGGNTDAQINLRRAWVDGMLGDFKVTAGRFNYSPVYAVVMDNEADGIKVNYNKAGFNVDLFWMRPAFANPNLWTAANLDRVEVFGGVVGYSWGAKKKLNTQLAYYDINNKFGATNQDDEILELAASYRFDANWRVQAEYLHGSENLNDGGKNGWMARVDFGQTKRNKPGTYNIRAVYYDVPAAASIDATPELDLGFGAPNKTIAGVTTTTFDGYKGWQIGASFMAAKNIELNIDYFDFESQNDINSANNEKLVWTYVRFYF